MSHPQLIEYFTDYFGSGKSFNTISAARKQAAEVLGEAVAPGMAVTKLIDESIEASLIRVARSIVEQSDTNREAYDRLVELHQRQPILSVRSSTSVLQQAYSTPIPIAFAASTLADIQPNYTVYEPTAGHGALLLGSGIQTATVNELNPDRAADLRSQGFTVTEHNATAYLPEEKHDRIICNPPFGVVKQANGRTQHFDLPDNRRGTSQVDQVIALRALESMKNSGRAVLILGGQLGQDAEKRSQRYNSLESRSFFKTLYDNYNVTQHFSVWGALYIKQGAGFPIDMIVIEGRGKSNLYLPAARVPEIFKSFDDLRELIPDERIQHLPQNVPTQTTGISQSADGTSTGRDGVLELQGVLQFSEPANRVDDPAVASAGILGENPQPNGDGATPLEFDAAGTAADRRSELAMDIGLGSDVSGVQRRTDAESGAGISSTSGGDEPRSRGAMDRDARPDLTPGLADGSDSGLRGGAVRVLDIQPLEVPYVPRSKGRIAETIIPTNMISAAQKALDNLERSIGDIDEFVASRLGYDSTEKLWQYFYAEQIDAIALAFHQRDQGNIFLNGDQTGNGKGRFGAANLIDASRQNLIPIFVTQKPNLYNAMLNDLADVGRPGFRVFATDNNLSLNLDDGRRLVTGDAADQEAEMQQIMQSGMEGRYQAIFTTYSQLQTVNGEEPFRREFFRTIASNAVFIFDESHEAGGVSKANSWNVSGPANRADFVRELVDLSAGTVFMSATSIKNSAVVDLYARRSDARLAVERMSNLETILKDGGVPLQQMFATKFVASGQMVRRGRSMTGITFDAKVVPVDRIVAEDISRIMRSINLFDEAKQQALKEINKELKREAKALAIDNAVGQVGATSINFTSLMHNAIDQSLLAQKAEATVQEAISAIQRGEKPIIAVASTMDAFIDWYAKENNLKAGDPIDFTFGDVLYRYLERSRDILVKDHEGKQTRQRLTDAELGEVGIAAYQDTIDLIAETDLSSIPLSSIDYIKWRLTQEGYKVDEITGRKNIIEYSQMGLTAYGLRPNREVRPQGKINIVNRFNSGDLDVVILNKSGATGISLHASEKFRDQQPRHMIVAQAERDINQVMQMLGRANRFGQVVKPNFTLLMSDLPAEKRLGAILAKKMAELNANVTAARESDLSIANVVDFMNVYGEEIVIEILEEDFELQAKLGYPLSGSNDGSEIAIINRVTGRIPLLTIQEQEELYNLIESETMDLIAQKEAMGESVLQADQMDLDARTIARMEVIPDESGIDSEFTGPVCLEVVDAKVPIKPMTQLQVVNAVRENLGLESVTEISQHDFDAVGAIAQQKAQEIFKEVEELTATYRSQATQNVKSDVGLDKLNARLDEQLVHLQKTLSDTAPGTTVRVVSPEGNIFYGVVSRISQKGHNGSPAAPTNWKAQILIDHRSRQLTIPLSKFNRGTDETVTSIVPQSTNWSGEDIYEAFDIRQTQNQRSELQIFTGNPIKAYERFPKGKFVNYTNDRGEILQGLVMPASFDIQEVLRDEPVAFHEPRQVKAFLTEITHSLGSVKTLDELLTIKIQAGARFGDRNAIGFVLQTVKSGAGDKYSVDADIIAAAGAEFYSVSDRMECVVPADQIDDVLKVIMQDKRWALAAFDYKDQARNFLGLQLPEFQQVEAVPEAAPIEAPTQPPEVDAVAVNRKHYTAVAENYLAVKEEHPNSLVLQRSKSREFYQAFFEDAVTIGQELDLVVMNKDLGPTAQRVPTLLLPAKPTAMKRFVDHLEEKGFQVILDEGQQSNDLKAIADQVRDQDLASVVERLGLEPDRHDKHKWCDDNHIISITGEKFHDWAVDKGGGGAIDLVMHVQQCDFRTAVEWLSGHQLPEQSSPKQSQPRILQLPESNAANWPAVKQYLTETRGLPTEWIDALHDRGLIYADQHQNAVFVRHQEERSDKAWVRGDATGACLRGTQGEPFHGLSPGSERKAGYFWLRRGQEEVKRVVLVESPIDAISLAALEKEKLAELGTTVYLSTDGSGAIPAEALKVVLAKGGQVLVAFDADKAGEKMAWRVAGEVLGVKRMVPAMGKDWNERLLAKQHPAPQAEQQDRQMFKTLWKWYRVAADVGHPEAYLKRITEVARDVVDGKDLSEKASQAMAKDLASLDQKVLAGEMAIAGIPTKKEIVLGNS